MWRGILDSDDLPSIVNPEKGYIVNTNNRVVSHRAKHSGSGLSHGFSFNHRAVRISELLEELIANEKPIRVKEIQAVTQDLLDV